MTSRRRSMLLQASVYATVLVAFFLRVYRLADKNIWWDEGWSLWLAQKDWAWIALRTAADEHPPLHYWMLRLWDSVAGWNAFAGRYLSVVFGVLTVALLYRIGKRIGGTGVGSLAALVLAVARFHIWWSQDIKNYTPSILFAFAALWFALILLDQPNRKAVAGYAVFAALALWTHYLSAFVLLAVNVYAGLVFTGEFVVWGRQQNSHCEEGSERSGETDEAIFPVNSSPLSARKIASPSALAMTFRHFPHYTPSGAEPRVSKVRFLYWLAANVLGAILFLPWLWLYLNNAATWTAAPVFDFGLFLKLVATVLPLGVTTNIDNYALLTLALTVLAVLGALSSANSKQSTVNSEQSTANSRQSTPERAEVKQSAVDGSEGTRNTQHALPTVHWSLFTAHYSLLPALIVVLPPILLYVLSLTPVAFFAPKIQARYLLVLFPAYALLLALGVARLRRFSLYAGAGALLLVLGASAFVLRDYYADRRLTDEYATLANTLNSFERPDDLVLLDTDQEWPTFLYYLRSPLEWLGVPNGQTMTTANADALVRRALLRYRSVWMVAIPDGLATDPQHLVEARLASALPKQFEQTFGDKRLALYSADPRDLVRVPRENFVPQHRKQQQVHANLEFLGFDLPATEVRAGDSLRVVTYWNASAASDTPIALGHNTQTIHIPEGERVRVETDFVVPPDGSGEMAVGAGNLQLALVTVQPRAPLQAAGPITHALDHPLGEAIHLIGYDLPATVFHPGDPVPMTLYWRAEKPVATDYVVFVHLLGEQFNSEQGNFLWGQVDRVPRGGTYPTTAWVPKETVADVYQVPVDAHAPTGRYQIEVGLYDPATGGRLAENGGADSVLIGEIEVR